MGKEAMNLKDSKQECVGGYGGSKEKGEVLVIKL